MDWYEFSKFAASLMRPFVLAALLLAAGCLLLWLAPARRAGKYTVTAGGALMIAFAYGVPFDFIGRRLEAQNASLLDTSGIRDTKWIVVLGAGHYPGPALPISSRISSMALHRIAEGIRLHRELPLSTIIFSGAAVVDGVSIAQLSGELAHILGVPPERVIVVDKPRNTAEEARCVHALVGNDRFVIVTSALHMPRALALFSDQGMHPRTAPTGHRPERGDFNWRWFLPSAGNLIYADMVFHELLGIAWARTGAAKSSAEACVRTDTSNRR